MRKIVLAFLIILVSVSVSFGASTKVSELTETQTLTDDDLFLVSTYADGSYTSKYIAKSYLKTALGNVTTILNDTLWDAAGDLVYGTGANAGARLAIGAPYALLMTNSGATAPAWTYELGATGTRLTKIWATDLEVTNAPTVNGAALTTILQPLDGELTALAGLTSAANAIPYFTGSGTAGVISSSADMVSLLESADYATALSNLGGQASDSALTSLTSKTFSKTALTGTGGLDTVLYGDLADGDIGMVGTIAGVIYWYVFEASSATAESSPSVIAPDDAGANNGRWLLKLYCDGSSCTVPQGATGAIHKLLEASGGENFRAWSVPNSLTANLTLTHPNTVPTAMSVLAFPAPTEDVSTGSWLPMTDRLVATFDGGGAEIADSKKVYIYVPWDCTVTGWTILADQSGAIKVDVWNDTYANYPPTNDDTITAGHEPEIAASATKAQDLDVADWGGESLTGGTILAFNVDSCTTITWAQVTLHVVRR